MKRLYEVEVGEQVKGGVSLGLGYVKVKAETAQDAVDKAFAVARDEFEIDDPYVISMLICGNVFTKVVD